MGEEEVQDCAADFEGEGEKGRGFIGVYIIVKGRFGVVVWRW